MFLSSGSGRKDYNDDKPFIILFAKDTVSYIVHSRPSSSAHQPGYHLSILAYRSRIATAQPFLSVVSTVLISYGCRQYLLLNYKDGWGINKG